MENSLDLLKHWILTSAKADRIKVLKLNWPERYSLPIHDYTISVVVGNHIFKGHGTDRNEDLAICKAMSEAYERFCVSYLGLINSNGCAVHLNKECAESNALIELIERDSFLHRFIKFEKFKALENTALAVNLPLDSKLINYLITDQNIFIILTRITISERSNIFGMGSGKTVSAAMEKGEFEAFRQFAYIYDNKVHLSVDYKSLISKKILSFDDHGDLALTKEHFDQIQYLFEQNGHVSDTYKLFDCAKTQYKTVKLSLDDDNPFCNIPLVFAKAKNDEAQELFVGKTEDSLNHTRIFPEPGRKLNLCLHPFR